MHAPTEGGLAMGLHELAEAAGVGLLVDAQRIEILPECRTLCEEFGLDPLGTIASGSLLITLPAEEADLLIEALVAENIPASFIGRVQSREMGTMLMNRGEVTALPTFPRDEITKLFAQ